MKKIICLLMSFLLLFSMASCRKKDNKNDAEREKYFESDFEFEKLNGKETEVQVLYEGGVNTGSSGYPDQRLPKAKENLMQTGSGVEGIAQYFFTKTLYNYNVKNNNIRINYQDWGWADGLTQKLTAAFNSQLGPDVIIGETQVPTYAKNGILEPFPDELATWIRENVVKAAYDIMEINGKIYGVSIHPSFTTLVWNKKILTECGVDQKYIDNAPETWDEYLAVCKKIKDNGKGKYYAGGLYCGDDLGGYMRSAAFIYSNGGSFVDEEGKPSFNTQENIETLKYFRDISKCTQKGMLSVSESTVYNAFNQGKLAYVIDGSWRIKQSMGLKIDVGFGAIPHNTDKSSENILMGAAYYCVPNFAKKKAEAFKVIKSMLVEETQKVLGSYNFTTIVNKNTGNSEFFKEKSPEQSKVFKILDTEKMISLPLFIKNSSSIYQKYGEALKKSVISDDDIETLLNTAQTKALQLYN